MLSSVPAAPLRGTVRVPDTIAWPAFSIATALDLTPGAVDAIVQSGILRSIANGRLRTRLSELRDQMVDVLEEQLVARQITLRLAEYLEGTG